MRREEDLERQAHWAKYISVLTSGYLEQSLKEVLLDHSSRTASPRVARYVEQSWSNSRNMNTEAICTLLGRFDGNWRASFEAWLIEDEKRKGCINAVVDSRNKIAHGEESNTTGVTMHTVSERFQCACGLVDLVEELAG
ncbi:HEPN domain-containing protein [Brevundimonas sp. GCM10030266]|uniref:HEPN domain-containing protein n=1 Tax=Brevundimonas sp. GCM10030266 TaxID=3273386 RepID=UPI00361E62EB